LAHIPHENTSLTLQRPGKSKKWHPKFYIRKDRRVYMLRGQWLHFVRDNHVQEGDICLLVPTKPGRKFVLTVYLLRATETSSSGGSETGFQRVSPCHGRSGTKMDSAGEHVSTESSVREISDGSLNTNDSGGPSDPPYILSFMSHLSRSQRKIIGEKVQAIQSKVTIYIVIMKRTSVVASKQMLVLLLHGHLPVPAHAAAGAAGDLPELGLLAALPEDEGKKKKRRRGRFLKHFAGKLSRTIKLESPNGSLYDVEVMEHYNKMVLRHGWEAFVDAHHIEENDSLLFRNIENSVFEVLIFDSDGCEKMFRCSGIKNTPSFGERSLYSVDISSNSQHDTTESSGSERVARCVKGRSSRHGKTSKMPVTSSSSGGSGEDIPSENEYFELDDLHKPPGADYVISCRSHLSPEQKERVITLIQEIQPEITVYVTVMRKSHVHTPARSVVSSLLLNSKSLLPALILLLYLILYMLPYVITKEYASAHFPHGNANVTLQRPGKSKKWHPEFYKRKDRSIYMLRGQ
ncbi:B3 domain-containing protein, partial [Dichanthelium oligosanthes]